MEITQEALPWTSEDESNWNSFLQTNTGKRLIPKLVESVPSLLAKGEINEILIRSGELRGFQLAISSVLALTHSAPLPPTNVNPNYPPLEDDAQWTDGEKLQPKL